MMKSKEGKRKPIFEIIILLVIIIPLIFISFIYSAYRFEITIPIIMLIALIVIVLLSNSFDNFQLGKILTLSKNVSEYKAKNEKLENEKNELINQLINFSIQSQHSSNTNINGITLEELKKNISVEKATEKEINDNKSEEDDAKNKTDKNEMREQRTIINRKKLEALAIKKCFGEINYASILREVKVSDKFNDIDPISTKPVIFDAFYKDNEVERFIKIIYSTLSPMFFDRLYVMLNKLYHYRKIKNSNSNLTLIIVQVPDKDNKFSFYSSDRLKELFLPAISCGLLNILEIQVSEEEINEVSDKRI